MNNFKDVEKKIEYYKSLILKEFIKKGIYPENELINSRLESINLHLSVFKNYNVTSGRLFNANEYNERLKMIYIDIYFLYEILYELTVLEYNKLQNFINSHLNELNSIVKTYNKRAEYENSTTTLGNTLLFQNNSFLIENKDSTTIIDLGSIKIPNAAVLACISNINNIKPEDVIFKFKDVATSKEITAAPFNYNNEQLVMPGDINRNKFIYNLQEDQVIEGPLLLNIKSEINIKNNYIVLGGKNNIFVNYKDKDGFIVEEKPLAVESLAFKNKAYINFYILGGNSISFRFNKKPISANFPIDTQRVDGLNYIHHFFIECDEDFSFQFELDRGDVFAIKETGLISNKNLYYTGSDQIKDFTIIEETTGDTNEYSVSLEAYNNNEDIDIESIIIKQME